MTENKLGSIGEMQGGHYHWNNVVEIVIPDGLQFWYQTDKSIRLKSPADTRFPRRVDQEQAFDPPECVHWRKQDAPADEQDSLFLQGDEFLQKNFKGNAPTWWRMWATAHLLEVGKRYEFNAPVFLDLVDHYTAQGKKVFAPDPLSGEVMLEVRSNGRTIATTEWMDGEQIGFGVFRIPLLSFVADSESADCVLEFRGRWGLSNNGVFTANWRVLELGATPEPVPTPNPALEMLAEFEAVAAKWRRKIGVQG